MNKVLFKGLIIALLTLFTQDFYGQKFGHINSNDLLLLMPERKEAEATLQKEAQELEATLTSMTKEYQEKVAIYQKELPTMSDILKETKGKEIQSLEQRIQEFQVNAQDALQKREAELLQPIIDKARAAVKKVADDNKYSYVFDSGLGVLVHAPEGDDLLPLVKTELGLP
ncbi:MAG: OmpH family outer membrane protein [Flavobacteriales bacterium]|nr:OmpH family outer membrane protein [Flavobacteriales bacterium]